ncbi:hypothetical protein DM02DRAFT_420954 [Periconia macrospinosa]|uniref:Uncharacterized protein n=1 Tax=Periconia macrospinosa TaxID=97972 RepID=A0A2V1CYR1_9PLEO|nr:hypothetical protein DM02DRAFT_420954 [Periconia macrospinosa]
MRLAEQGMRHSDIAHTLTAEGGTQRTLCSIRRRIVELQVASRGKTCPASKDAVCRSRHSQQDVQIIVILRDEFPEATWAQITTAFNICRKSSRPRTEDAIKRKYATTKGKHPEANLNAIRRQIRPPLRKYVVQKALPFFAEQAIACGSACRFVPPARPLRTPLSCRDTMFQSLLDRGESPCSIDGTLLSGVQSVASCKLRNTRYSLLCADHCIEADDVPCPDAPTKDSAASAWPSFVLYPLYYKLYVGQE